MEIASRSVGRAAAALLAALCLCPALALARSAHGHPSFSSARPLLLKASALPPHYRYKGSFVQDSVQAWDGNIGPVMRIDEKYGWMEAAQESALDPRKYEVDLSVQLFRTARGARGDFGQFFTNAHPETIYEPGSTWLGGTPVRGLGDVATLYRIRNDSSRCPQQLVSGLSFVYGNGIFSVGVCLHTVGESGAQGLAHRLLKQALRMAR